MRSDSYRLATISRQKRDFTATALFAIALTVVLFHCRVSRAGLTQYDSKYYTIYTDLTPEQEREAEIRMTRMAEEYHDRTRGFAGQLREKMPFYLYKSSADYYASGGMPGSAGVFIATGAHGKLMAIAGEKTTLNTWHVVQHEGFHQFAHAVIGGDMPIWLNEGLAEYFGESIFTGDGFVTGIVPPWRLARLQREIQSNSLKSTREIMNLSAGAWGQHLAIQNYDQAWSMVHFLVNGDHGKYQQAFSGCIRELSGGQKFQSAWLDTLGPVDGFQDRWKDYWLSQPRSPTSALYARAAVATLTSFLARATVMRQTFTDFNAFAKAAASNALQIDPDDWLPPSLIDETLRSIDLDDDYSIVPGPAKQPTIRLRLNDGTVLVGSYSLHGRRVDHTYIDIDDMPRILKDAGNLLTEKNGKEKARQLVQSALHDNPKSAFIADARKFLQSLR